MINNITSVKKNSFRNILEYIFMLFVILGTNSVYVWDIGSIINKSDKLVIDISLLLLYLLALLNIKQFTQKLIAFVFLFGSVTVILFMIEYLHFKFSLGIIKSGIITPIILVTYFYYLSKIHNINSLFIKFENIVIVLACISLIFWIMGLLNIPTNVTMPIHFGISQNYNVGTKIIPGYFNIDFFAQNRINFLGLNLVRNTGMFVEAPIYSSVLNIAFFIDLFLRKKTNLSKYRLIILIVTIISTTSTNGMVLLIISYIYKELVMSNKGGLLKLSSIISIPLVLIILLFIIINKISGTNNSSLASSANIRFNDFLVTFNVWKRNILLGGGIHNNILLVQNMPSWRVLNGNGQQGISTGFMRILAYGGILLETYYITPMLLVLKKSKKMCGFSLLIFLLFILEGIDTYFMLYIIISYLWFMILFYRSDN